MARYHPHRRTILDDIKIPGPIDIRRFDIRIARIHLILQMSKFVDNSKYYMHYMHYYQGPEDSWDFDTKIIVNDLPSYYSQESLIDRMVVMLCNPFWTAIEGVKNKGKMLCAVQGEKVELLLSPPGGAEGDEITVDGYPRDPDHPFMMPHERPFEIVSPDFWIDANGQAVYKNIPLKVEGKGIIRAETLSNCPLKFL